MDRNNNNNGRYTSRMTYTVLAHCASSGETGVGITTASIAFGGCGPTYTLAGDIVVSQAYWRAEDGLLAARHLGAGSPWRDAMHELRNADTHLQYRQLGAIMVDGECHGFTGDQCRGHAGHRIGCNSEGDSALVMGNGLCGVEVLEAMLRACLVSRPGFSLAERLLCSLEAGRDAGGQGAGERHMAERSAKLRVNGGTSVSDPAAPVLDLQVDAHPTAVEELRRLHTCCIPTLAYNALRSVDPPGTPSWGEWGEAHPEAAGALPPLMAPLGSKSRL